MLLTQWVFWMPLLTFGADAPVDYAREIKPILAERCYSCHGALKQEAGLRLDTAELIRIGGDSGAAVVPGQHAESLLIERVSDPDGSTRMPPEDEGSPLDPDTIARLRAWINQGAEGPDDEQPESDPREHWAFQSPLRPTLPDVQQADWMRSPIDVFIAAEHEKQGLKAQPYADKRILLRRVYLDLIGLPPTAAELDAFVADSSPDALEKVVDRLLDSPQYGERWGRHWMDIWRYSDWWGLGAEVRNSQKHIWHWRDWIVESVNEDAGYDEMLKQMLAADELYPNDLSKLRATGYLARHYFKFNRNTWLDETVEHTAKAFFGITVNCSKCHDHKYDPFSQEDYYRFRAFFEPYQIRTDQVPGEVDYDQNGIPRAFDCNLEAPTYLFIRGDEKQPLKNQPLQPGVPELLQTVELEIEPIDLPPEAHRPGLRPWIVENYLKEAEGRIAAARDSAEKARKTLEASLAASEEPVAEATSEEEADEPTSNGLIKDDFRRANPDLWETIDGEWKYEDGRLLQQRDGGNVRSALRLKKTHPENFEARVRFAITGGQMWKSVGVTFDSTEDNEHLAYLSAYAGGPKVQLAYKQGAGHVYPSNAAQARPVKLGDMQELTLRVRGELVNVAVNGEHAIAWRSPLPRKAGRLELITFDAQAAFDSFELRELPDDEMLVEASAPATPQGTASSMPSVEEARALLLVAEKELSKVELQPASIRARAAADRASADERPNDEVQELIREAARSEKAIAAAQAAENLAKAELELIRAAPEKSEEAEKKVAAARDALVKAEDALKQPGDTYKPLRGAVKSVESPTESSESLNRPFPKTSTGRRTALAAWASDRRNPLTARVAVNHIWARHFNSPLVPTVFDFGRKGSPPTHPELLDWLAVEFMENGWSMKHIHRVIVTSGVYRLSSSAAGAETNLERDPENRYYWRMNSTRMESQIVRDSLLHLGGELDLALGGPSIPVNNAASKRRSLYFVHSHNEHHRFLSVFDDADVLDCYRRDQSIVPQQALALSNSELALTTASRIAERIRSGLEELTDEEFIQTAFLTVLASVPNEEELRVCQEAIEAWIEADAHSQSDEAKQRARVHLVHALLNHNDFITIR